jgi:MFS family permease
VDEAIDRLGYGFFQRRVLVAAGLCSASDAMEILMLSFLAFSVQVEWNLSIQESNSIIAIVFVGAFFGTLILGRLGDVCGRKPVFVMQAAIVAIFGLATCFCQNYLQLVIARFLVGVGIGGSTVPFDTYAEFLPSRSRGQNLVLPSYFWSMGTVMVAVIAHLTLGQDSSRWRLLCLWCSIPCMVATVVAIVVVPESPRWLLTHRRDQYEALKILKQAARLNGKDPDLLFPPGVILTDLSSHDKYEHASDDSSGSIWQLFSPQWYRTSLTIWMVWACYASLYYGTVLVVTLVFSSASSSYQGGDEDNDDHSFHFDYGAIVASTLAEVAGATFVLCTVDRFGRRPMHSLSFFLGGSMVLSLCLFARNATTESKHNREVLVMIAFLARMFIFSGSAITWIWTAEILTTEVRSTGHSVANAAARIGGFVTPFWVSSSTPFPVIGISMMSISIFIIACSRRLPETHGAPMGGGGGGGVTQDDHHHMHIRTGYRRVSSSNATVEITSDKASNGAD